MTESQLALPAESGRARISSVGSPPVRRITVVIAANSPIMHRGIESILADEEDIHLVGHATCGNDAIKMISERSPDIALLKFSLPDRNALSLLESLGRTTARTRAVILAEHMSEEQFLRAVELGARGVFLEDMPAPMLARCIRTVHDGEEFFEKDVLQRSFGKLLRRVVAKGEAAHVLTGREVTTVRLAVDGLSNKQIAKKLLITEGTVKMHLHRSYVKLGVHGRMHLVLYVQKEGLV